MARSAELVAAAYTEEERDRAAVIALPVDILVSVLLAHVATKSKFFCGAALAQ